jgi:hypothetical protein
MPGRAKTRLRKAYVAARFFVARQKHRRGPRQSVAAAGLGAPGGLINGVDVSAPVLSRLGAIAVILWSFVPVSFRSGTGKVALRSQSYTPIP